MYKNSPRLGDYVCELLHLDQISCRQRPLSKLMSRYLNHFVRCSKSFFTFKIYNFYIAKFHRLSVFFNKYNSLKLKKILITKKIH